MSISSFFTNSSALVPTGSSIADKASNFFSSKLKFQRRDAIKYEIILGHKFDAILLDQPTICSQCRIFILGLTGHACKKCKLICHKKCFEKIDSRCASKSDELEIESIKTSEHKFKVETFMSPTFCDHCGVLIVGFFKQGLRCDQESGGCDMTIHHECRKLVGLKCTLKERKSLKDFLSTIVSNKTSKEQSTAATKFWSKISFKEFQPIRILGQGSLGKVILVKLKKGNEEKEFAIKVIKKTNRLIASDPESAKTELRALNFGRNYPFLSIVHCCFQSEDRLYFVMEYANGRDLFHHVIERGEKFSEERTRFYSAEIFLALKYLHSNRIIHRDIKLENIILEQSGHCKLVDFGIAKELFGPDMKTGTYCGTLRYFSPEIIRENRYDYSVDWWAFGVLIFEMLLGYSPFDDGMEDEVKIKSRILEEDPLNDIPRHFLSNNARDLLRKLMTKNPQNRLGCQLMEGCWQAIQDHPFFVPDVFDLISAKHYWEAIEKKQFKVPLIPSTKLQDSTDDQKVSLTPIHESQKGKILQEEFKEFSYYSDSFNELIDGSNNSFT